MEVWHYGFSPDGGRNLGMLWSTPRYWTRKIAQTISRGWSSDDTWCLQYPMAVWLLPRLQCFRENATDPNSCSGHPASIPGTDKEAHAEWVRLLDEMLFACKFTIWDDGFSKEIEREMGFDFEKDNYWKNSERAGAGWKLFGEWLPALWN